jgi:hypothetical protein
MGSTKLFALYELQMQENICPGRPQEGLKLLLVLTSI